MLREALRPHPDMRAIVAQYKEKLTQSTDGGDPVEYMTLHARVEPDMQAHPMCPMKKVLNLTDICDFLESKYHWFLFIQSLNFSNFPG